MRQIDTVWFSAWPPAYFSMSMATGIIAIASRLLGHGTLGWLMFTVNLGLYAGLWCVLAARLWWFPVNVLQDFCTHHRGAGFLTVVAATNLIGSQCAVFGVGMVLLPWILGFALVLWVGLLYGFLAVMTLGSERPAIENGLDGSWFLIVVATESLAILGSFVAQQHPVMLALGFFALAACLLGGVLYLTLLGLVFFRWMFIRMTSAEMTEPWWINLGAAAITTLAAAQLLKSPLLRAQRGFLDSFTVMFWATASFWFPLLLIAFTRKYIIEWRNLHYRPGIWSLVFPLGMYAAATETYAVATGTLFLQPLAEGMYWIALTAWLLGGAGMMVDLVPRCKQRENTRRST